MNLTMNFQVTVNIDNEIAAIYLSGELTSNTFSEFQEVIEQVSDVNIQKLYLHMEKLTYMSSAGLRVIIFAKQKMGSQVDIYIIGASEMITDTLKKTGFHHSVILQDSI
ncbi:STAS domain-containing protein [Gloeocapsa sp. PCC 73106]|uniref:STAS domain-containing protein n=1 Tax=Gloeocapsa sp. PCC 73106 TaxID=102232 RepID=UPI0002AC57AD|nr:STAS domain-containing protein [Gloeocapsa sp. PCC 73106]ELR97549.1 anti-anti-sigma factor [Gloeocapsa sp. PCC 73106]